MGNNITECGRGECVEPTAYFFAADVTPGGSMDTTLDVITYGFFLLTRAIETKVGTMCKEHMAEFRAADGADKIIIFIKSCTPEQATTWHREPPAEWAEETMKAYFATKAGIVEETMARSNLDAEESSSRDR